jgi:hypothetical protein
VAHFIGKSYEDDLLKKEGEILNKILEKTTFDYMQNNWVDRFPPKGGESIKHIRKGIIGDWKNHFTPDENQQMEKKFLDKFSGSGLQCLWDKYDIFSKRA